MAAYRTAVGRPFAYKQSKRLQKQAFKKKGEQPLENINATGFRIMSPMDETPAPGYREDEMVLAMAYVKWQDWKETYSEEAALKCGTLFKELNLPFRGEGGGSAT
jgi:hypothetical protein